jgi:hypothetical protein
LLREQVAQAELAVSGLVIDRAPASGVPSALPSRIIFGNRFRAVQGQHHPNVRMHHRSTIFRRHDQGFCCGLPFRERADQPSIGSQKYRAAEEH